MSKLTDLSIRWFRFQQDALREEDQQALHAIEGMPFDVPWWKHGIKDYRKIEQADLLYYKPQRLDYRAKTIFVESREPHRWILCRMFLPAPGQQIKGVLLNFHGGGWTVFNSAYQDPYLAHITDKLNFVTISVEYRRAPEHPFPEGPEDCFDIAEWLVDRSMSQFGAPFCFIDGSSHGAHLAALTALHLRKSRPLFHLDGLVLKYGVFNLTYTNPSIINAENPLIVTQEGLKETTKAFLPRTTIQGRINPEISPFYADLHSLKPLPPALFICGTRDILMDDTVFFGTKWMVEQHRTVVKVVPGALHGFMDCAKMPLMEEGWDCVTEFLELA